MIVYWALVLFPVVLSLSQPASRRSKARVELWSIYYVLLIFLSFRETGGDFPTYLEQYEIIRDSSLQFSLLVSEPGYALLNWLAAQAGLGIYGVNFVCALIFLFALFRAAKKETDPLLFVTISIPYFVIVVAMGYTRQGVAAGLILLAVVLLREKKHKLAAFSILVASVFHFSALAALILPIFSITTNYNKFTRYALRIMIFVALTYAANDILNDKLDIYQRVYVESGHYESDGAFLRSLVTGIAGALFLLLRSRFANLYDDYRIWFGFAALGLAAVPLSLVASTAVDRIGLYLIPFQLIYFTRLPVILGKWISYSTTKIVVIGGYLMYFFTWIHLGNYAKELWVPYRWILS